LEKRIFDEIGDTASRVLAYREERNGKYLTFAWHVFRYGVIIFTLSSIGIVSNNTYIKTCLISGFERFIVWVGDPLTLASSFILVLASGWSISRSDARANPYEKKLKEEGYLLLHGGKTENWVVNLSSGEAQKLTYFPPDPFLSSLRKPKKPST
jgi:hypothetical protein